VRPLVAIVTSPWHVLAIRLSDRAGKGLRTAPRDALLAESVDPSVRGRAFGVHRAADHLGAVIGPILASLLLFLLDGNLRAVFAAALVPGLLAVMVVVFRVRERAGRVEPAPDVAAKSVIGFRGHDPAFPRYLLVVFLFTLGNATDAFLLLRANALGVSAAAIPLLWGVHHVSKSAWSVVGGVMADRIGARRAILLGWLIYAGTYAGFGFAAEAWQVWVLFIVYGLFYGLTEAPEKALVAQLAGEGRKGHAFGAYHFAIGVGALPASIGFGLLWQTFGPTTAFLAGGSLALVAVLALVVWVPADRGRSTN
jgi:MFS family permease